MAIPKFHPKWNFCNRGGHLWSKWSLKHVLALVLSVFIVYITVSAVLSQHLQIQATSQEHSFVIGSESHSSTSRTPAWFLLKKTRRAVRAAGGVPGSRLSQADREQWEKNCPCKGRNQLLKLWTRKRNESTDSVPSKASTKLDDLFQEYTNLHRTCTHGGNMTYVSDLYKQLAEGEVPNCKFLLVEFGVYGVGNRVLWLVSAYLYALLTQRVLLIDTRDTIHQILCDPFAGSSWQLPQNFPYSSAQRWVMPGDFFEVWDAWEHGKNDTGHAKEADKKEQAEGGREKEYTAEDLEKERKEAGTMIRATIDEKGRHEEEEGEFTSGRRTSLSVIPSNSTRRGPRPIFNSTQANDGWSPNPRFFCDKDQQRLHRVPWLSLSAGCLYFLPDLFAVPSFRPALEELFPRRDPLSHLLRQIVYPVDPVWNRVLSVYKTQFQPARRVIGMQVRFRNGGAMYQAFNDVVNDRMIGCARERDLIPDNSLDGTYFTDVLHNGGPPVVIFIASLHTGLQVHLRHHYAAILERQIETGKAWLKLIQMSHAGFQAFDLDGDFQAFAELVMLSLVDEILTSPMSTFGYIAQAYGGLRPLVVEFDHRKSAATCERGQSSDACYQMAVSEYTCPADPELDGKHLPDVVPYLRPCQDTDGLQLVPPSDM